MARHILIADPDPQTARLLAPPLRHRGYQVSAVKTGSRALEICVLRAPDLVLFDAECPLLDPQTFRQIVRSNPHTEQLPILVTGSIEAAAPLSLRDGVLLKPFNVDEVLARIEQIFRRVEAAQQTKRGDQGMEGTLGQLAVTDLLQILGQNRKDGLLKLSSAQGNAQVRLSGGLIAAAQAEGVSGAKALFRLLQWREGLFSFIPTNASEPGDINKSVEELLLEGMRQSDELPALRASLPDPGTRLALGPAAKQLAGEQHPVTAEVLELCRGGATVAEILERSKATDYAAAQALLTLLRKGLLRPAPGNAPTRREHRPLLPPGGLHVLRARLRPDAGRVRGKILLASPRPELLAAFLGRFEGMPEYHPEPEPASAAILLGFGTVGRFDASEELILDLLVLPTSDASRPLWQPFSSRALGAIVLVPEGAAPPEAIALITFLCREAQVPVVLPGLPETPAALVQLELPATPTSAGAEDALRDLLALAARARTRL